MRKGDEFEDEGRRFIVMEVKRTRCLCFDFRRKGVSDFLIQEVLPCLTGRNFAEAVEVVDEWKQSIEPGTILHLDGKRVQVDAIRGREVCATILDENPKVRIPIDGPWWFDFVGDEFLQKVEEKPQTGGGADRRG